ncbi:MAG: hypothetical protein GX801_07280 [Fibrobacter sp.]|nr:hypothetical protein [Fibrobacter sp.]
MKATAITSTVSTYDAIANKYPKNQNVENSRNKVSSQDTYTPSANENTEEVEKSQKKSSISFKDFDYHAFKGEIKSKLLEMVGQAHKASKNEAIKVDFGDDILYKIGDDVEVAEVPEYWNAENTSNRIVEFAMSFRSLAQDIDDDTYINEIRNAIEEGFKQAKNTLGNLPGPAGKLFNDTYNLTMEKLNNVFAPKEV